MPNDAITIYVNCPYYDAHTEVSISCEWLKGTLNTTEYTTPEQRLAHMQVHCCDNWKACTVAKIMDAYYAKYGDRAPKRFERVEQRREAKTVPGQVGMF